MRSRLRVKERDGHTVDIPLPEGLSDQDIFWSIAKTCRLGGVDGVEFPLRLFADLLRVNARTSVEVWDRTFDEDRGVRWKVDLQLGAVYNMSRPDEIKELDIRSVPYLDEAEMYDFARSVKTCANQEKERKTPQ